MVTIRDVAQRAGVSISTVSHVINETRFVSDATQARVRTAMQELNYRPNQVARSLRNRKTKTLGVLLPDSTNPYFATILAGIEDACFDNQYNIIIGNANNDSERELAYLEVLLSKQIDGVLLISTGGFDGAIKLLTEHDIPVVLVDRTVDSANHDEVRADNEMGGHLATKHLLELGHMRIGCIAGPTRLLLSHRRLSGYRRALQDFGIAYDPSLVVEGNFDHDGGYTACKQLMGRGVTAIFACNDMMAVGALRALNEAGLCVPEDVSIIGFDDIPLALYTVPRLTTIAQPKEMVGQLAVEQLLACINNPDHLPERIILPVELVERESSMPYEKNRLT